MRAFLTIVSFSFVSFTQYQILAQLRNSEQKCFPYWIMDNHYFIQFILVRTKFFQKVYCGHEYSIQNLTFGNHVEPENEAIRAKLDWCQSMRNANPAQPTIPSTIGK